MNAVLAQTVNTCMATVSDAPVCTVPSVIGWGDDEAVLVELLSRDEEEHTGAPHIVVAATPDRKLVDLARPVYASYDFSDTIGSEELSFDYQRGVRARLRSHFEASYSCRVRPVPGARREHMGSIRPLDGLVQRRPLRDASRGRVVSLDQRRGSMPRSMIEAFVRRLILRENP